MEDFTLKICLIAVVLCCLVVFYSCVAWLITALVNLIFITAWQFTSWQYMGMGALILIARNLFKK